MKQVITTVNELLITVNAITYLQFANRVYSKTYITLTDKRPIKHMPQCASLRQSLSGIDLVVFHDVIQLHV